MKEGCKGSVNMGAGVSDSVSTKPSILNLVDDFHAQNGVFAASFLRERSGQCFTTVQTAGMDRFDVPMQISSSEDMGSPTQGSGPISLPRRMKGVAERFFAI